MPPCVGSHTSRSALGGGRSLAAVLGVAGLVLMLWAPARAPAQGLRVGVRVGPSFGFLNDSPIPFVSEPGVTAARTNVRVDLHVGAHAVWPFGGATALQPELLFVRKGGHLSRLGEGLYAAEQYRLSYLQAHLLGRRDVALPGPLSLHVLAGPTVAVATGGTVQRALRTRTAAVDERIPLLRHGLVRRWDAGLLLGTGLAYPVGVGGATAGLELRYNAGVRAIFTEARRPASARTANRADPPPLSRTPPPLRHDVILVSLTVAVPLGAP